MSDKLFNSRRLRRAADKLRDQAIALEAAPKGYILQGALALVLLINIGLFICACYSCRQVRTHTSLPTANQLCQCYISPCEEGDALQDMYRVNDGMGFQIVRAHLLRQPTQPSSCAGVYFLGHLRARGAQHRPS